MEVFLVVIIILFLIIRFLIKIGEKEILRQKAIKEELEEEIKSAPNVDVYETYTNWCNRKNAVPINLADFDKLVDENGSIDFKNLINYHIKDIIVKEDFSSKNKSHNNIKNPNNKDFANSAIIGYVTKSTTKGTVFGGDFLGAKLGSHLNKKSGK